MNDIKSMIGKTFTKVYETGYEELIFENDEEVYTFYHEQDCCESVRIEDITGDLSDLVDSPITFAEESCSDSVSDDWSSTWTFYKFATVHGWVDVRWLSESNGYYSESVDLHYRKKNLQ